MNDNEPLNAICLSTPVGWIAISASSRGICQLSFKGQTPPSQEEMANDLRQLCPSCRFDPQAHLPLLQQAKTAVLEYFARRIPVPELPLDVGSGTAFQQDVWRALCAIPFGETRSYLEIADSIGKPRAYRAVGRACGRNPVAIIIPCHRVIARDGALGGFSSGLQTKRALLDLERKP